MVPLQVWFRVFVSPSTVLRQVLFGLPLFRLPCGVQCSAVSAGDVTRFFPKHVPNPTRPAPHDGGLYDILKTTSKQLLI